MTQQAIARAENEGRQSSVLEFGFTLLMGVYFGFMLVKAEVVRLDRVHAMFRFEEFHLYGVIIVALLVATPLMWLIRRYEVRDVSGHKIEYQPKPFHKGIVFGGLIFGAGWVLTGACPGPIYTQIGGGEFFALFTLVGAIAGMYLYGVLQPKLPH